MGIWILIALSVLAFIVADAFFDVSAKFSRWWVLRVLPFWGSIWGRARDAVEKAHPAHSTWNGETPARAHYDWLGFLWKAKWAILIVLGFAFAVGALRGCTPIWGPSRDTLRAELEASRAETQTQETINDRDRELSAIANDVAALRTEIRSQAQRGRDAIAAAAPSNEAPLDPGLVAAWRDGLDRLCVARADGARADTCGSGASPTVP